MLPEVVASKIYLTYQMKNMPCYLEWRYPAFHVPQKVQPPTPEFPPETASPRQLSPGQRGRTVGNRLLKLVNQNIKEQKCTKKKSG